ncbi:hypothetical protein BDU57DRAFT_524284 [Ampelomyces quisqualis]|uniref:Uncharacterized protein n=1 Tax=Ampelomyces quisqualis TaxID=50730 RepID=A0A6A5Q8T3_AMPQU|nr:hypothetical protein BDU57DRAFT_524284 [Ampelomyces quisqualis]
MWDFEIFDKASRGPLGAALLLFRTKGRSLAALGALLIVLLLAIDTFFQQVVDLPERRVLQAGSSIPRVINYNPAYMMEFFQGYETQQYDSFMYPAVRPFFYGNGTQPVAFGNGTRPDIPLSCPTSTCTWPAYETLGVCSECTDASDLLEYRCVDTKIDWTTSYTGYVNEESGPSGMVCGYFYDPEDQRSILMSGYIANGTEGSQTPGEALLVRTFPFTELTQKLPISGGSIKFKHVRNPILDTLIVSSASTNDVYQSKPPVSQECVVSWCVKTIESTYESGHYTEQVKSTYQNTTTGWFPWESTKLIFPDGETVYFLIYNQSVVIDRHNSAPNASNSVIFDDIYTINNVTVSNVQMLFEFIFPSYFTDHGPSGKPMLRYKDIWNSAASFRELPFSPWQAPNNVTRHLERMATAMTNTMRSLPGMPMLDGAAYSKQVFVSIRWGWLSFPIVLLILTLVFLVATIIKTSSPGAAAIWKTSAMPALIYSLPKEAQGQLDHWGKGSGAPRKTRIKLLPDMGWRVSGHSYVSRSPRLASGERVPRGWI